VPSVTDLPDPPAKKTTRKDTEFNKKEQNQNSENKKGESGGRKKKILS